MCICTTESTRPRLFNLVTIVLVSMWVLIVSAVAHSVEPEPTMSAETFVTKLLG